MDDNISTAKRSNAIKMPTIFPITHLTLLILTLSLLLPAFTTFLDFVPAICARPSASACPSPYDPCCASLCAEAQVPFLVCSPESQTFLASCDACPSTTPSTPSATRDTSHTISATMSLSTFMTSTVSVVSPSGYNIDWLSRIYDKPSTLPGLTSTLLTTAGPTSTSDVFHAPWMLPFQARL